MCFQQTPRPNIYVCPDCPRGTLVLEKYWKIHEELFGHNRPQEDEQIPEDEDE